MAVPPVLVTKRLVLLCPPFPTRTPPTRTPNAQDVRLSDQHGPSIYPGNTPILHEMFQVWVNPLLLSLLYHPQRRTAVNPTPSSFVADAACSDILNVVMGTGLTPADGELLWVHIFPLSLYPPLFDTCTPSFLSPVIREPP